MTHNVGGRVFYYLGELDTFICSGDTETDRAVPQKTQRTYSTRPKLRHLLPNGRAGAARLGPRPGPALCTITHPRQRGLIDAITWE